MSKGENWGSQKEVFEKAKAAAAKKEVNTFLRCIHESRFLDGAKRTLEAEWHLDSEATHEILAISVDRFYEAITEGKKILFPAAYLLKIITNEAAKTYNKNKGFEEFNDSTGYSSVISTHGEVSDVSDEAGNEERKRKGIEIARSLLPKIGEETVQRVMAYYIDAVEKGVEDVTSREVAEALALSQDSVRVWKQRGFERLKRAAIEAGYRKEFLRDIATDNVLNQDIEEE